MKENNAIIIWLVIILIFTFLMVVIGGITRLTGSGLSMVDWRPIMGVIPPLGHQDWITAFTKYQQFPEYNIVNINMTLTEFKHIFFWEYLHRFWGRLIGVTFFFPGVYFAIRKKIPNKFKIKLVIAFILGGLQGLLGWYMVKSGLVNIPEVSHFRLASHLLLAFFIMGYLLWIILDLAKIKKNKYFQILSMTSKIFLLLIVTQIFFGALTAGLHAGKIYNSFPLMGDSFFPDELFILNNLFENFVSNPAAVQFIHRLLGWSILFFIIFIKVKSTAESVSEKQNASINLTIILVILQFCLGVVTLLFAVPVAIASIHQAVGCLLFLSTVNMTFLFKEN